MALRPLLVDRDWVGCHFHNIPPFFIMVKHGSHQKGYEAMRQVLRRSIQGEVHEKMAASLPTD
jgi:hypothetical protein